MASINLGPDRDEAFRRYHELMGRAREAPRVVAGDTLLAILDEFLGWCQAHKAGRIYDWYRDYLESIAKSLPGDLAVAQLRPFHVQRSVDSQPGWKTGKRRAIVAVQRPFNWAERIGLIEQNPLRHVEKPPPGDGTSSSRLRSSPGSSGG